MLLSSVVIRNITVIGLTILVLAIFMLILKWGLNHFFNFGENLASKIKLST